MVWELQTVLLSVCDFASSCLHTFIFNGIRQIGWWVSSPDANTPSRPYSNARQVVDFASITLVGDFLIMFVFNVALTRISEINLRMKYKIVGSWLQRWSKFLESNTKWDSEKHKKFHAETLFGVWVSVFVNSLLVSSGFDVKVTRFLMSE